MRIKVGRNSPFQGAGSKLCIVNVADAEEAEGSEGNETVYIAVPVAVVVSLLVVVVVVLIVRKWRKRANGPEVFELPRRLRPTNGLGTCLTLLILQ